MSNQKNIFEIQSQNIIQQIFSSGKNLFMSFNIISLDNVSNKLILSNSQVFFFSFPLKTSKISFPQSLIKQNFTIMKPRNFSRRINRSSQITRNNQIYLFIL